MGASSGGKSGSSRDRFVGFAFAAAHLLLETDNDGKITFAAGARCGLVRGSLEDLVGKSISDYVPMEERSLLHVLLKRLVHKGKLDLTHVVMTSAAGNKFFAVVGGCRLPNYPDRCFFSISIRGQATSRAGGREIPDLAAFLPVLESRLVAADATEVSQALSMILIEGLANYDGSEKLLGILESYFLSLSSDGDSAVKLGADYYAVLHSEDGLLDDIRRDINQLLADNHADALSGSMQLWQVGIGKPALQASDVARAIAFTLKKFATENPNTLKISNIDNAVESLLNSTIHRVSDVRQIVEKKNFRLVYQPILRLSTGKVHHVEALMRLDGEWSPAEFVHFADGIGLIGDLDLLVVQEALHVLYHAVGRGLKPPDIAVNISATSLSSKIFMDQFEEILRPVGDLSKKILIDITDTAEIANIDQLKGALLRLRKMGIRRCLGDVRGGSHSFMLLNELKVDYAKIGGDLIREAMRDVKGRSVLQSIMKICSYLETLVIAEKVETEEQRQVLRSLGINLGQGYLLGQPSKDLPMDDAGDRNSVGGLGVG